MDMATSWDYRLVALSFAIAIFGSYVALDFASRMKAAEDPTRKFWFIGGALAMGLAIWTMHFIGMLALNMNMPVSYDETLSLLSILAAITGAGIAFFIMNHKTISSVHLITGGISMGLAIASMHYIGMASMKMEAIIHYNPLLFALSVLIAITASSAALWITFWLRINNPRVLLYQKMGSAIVMGIAIAGMHYTGMAAASYYHTTSVVSGLTAVPTVGSFKLTDLLILASVMFGIALLTLSSRSYAENQTIRELNLQILNLASRYQSMVSYAKEAIISIDKNSSITLWNTSAEKMFGYLTEEVLGKDIADIIIPPEYRQRHRDGMLKMLTTGEAPLMNQTIEIVAQRKNGEIFPIELSLFKSGIEGQVEYTTIIRDITQRKQIEEQLKSNEERFRLIVAGVRDYAILRLDPKGFITTWNEGAERIIGYKADEIIGQHFSIFYPKESVESGFPEYELKVAGTEGRFEDEGWRVRKNGELFWANVIITAIHSDNGELIGFSKITRDLTQSKLLEEQIKERTKQLEAANKELEAFSYSVSHDLRAPLRSIDGFSQAILEDYSDKLDDTGKQYLNFLRAGSQQMASLIDDMLQLSRLTRGALNLEDNVDLSRIARDIVTELQKQEPERHVEVDIENGLLVHGDKRLLQASLQNLLGNAWKFTSKHPDAHIMFKKMQQNGHPVYYVKDDGAGFDMQYSNKLFGAFQRLHGTTEFPGTGVGLATVARIIHRHGGEIWAEGEIEKGATFYFTLEP
jgi:PAS domain S-box-containing protein